jgi:hypothetical protein
MILFKCVKTLCYIGLGQNSLNVKDYVIVQICP